MRCKDNRIKLLNDLITGIKALKLYAWEAPFMNRVTEIRQEEISAVRRAAYLIGGSAVSFTGASVIFAVVSFSVFVITSDEIFTAQIAFVSLALVNNLTRPLTSLPNAITNIFI